MKMKKIKNIKMSEVEYNGKKVLIVNYYERRNDKDKSRMLSELFVEGEEGIYTGKNLTNNKTYEENLKETILYAARYIPLFENMIQKEMNIFLNSALTNLKTIMSNEDKEKWMWGVRAGVFNYNNKKYYAITYHSSSNNFKSYVLREDGLKMEGSDKLYYERAIINAIIKQEDYNNGKFEWNYCDDIGEEWGRIVDDRGFEEEEKRIEKRKNQLNKLEGDISKQMRLLFYVTNWESLKLL